MKKILALVMTALLLTACGDIDLDSGSSDSTITEGNSRIRFSQLDSEDYTVSGTCLTSDENNIYECETKVTDEQSAETIWNYLCDLTDNEPYSVGKADLTYDYHILNTLTVKSNSGKDFYTVEYGSYQPEVPEEENTSYISDEFKDKHSSAVFVRKNGKGDYECYDTAYWREIDDILIKSTEDNCVYLDITKLYAPSPGSKNFIILVDMYSNYAEKPVNYGKYLDSNGNIYEFDFNDINVFNTDFDFTAELYEHYENNTPVGSIDDETLVSICDCTYMISSDQEMESECTAFDAGKKSIMIIDWSSSDLTLFEISTEGNMTGQIDDENVDEIIRLWNNVKISEE